MTVMKTIQAGTVNARIIVLIQELEDDGEGLKVVDIGPATKKIFLFSFDNGAEGSGFAVRADLLTDGLDGKLVYYTVEGDLTVLGICRIQAYVELLSGKFPTGRETFMVLPNLDVDMIS